MKCLYCKKDFTPKEKAHNVKFCSISCKNKYYYHTKNLCQQQKDYAQKKLLNKYSKKELVQCKICGKWFRQVGSHIVQVHKITAREYREEYGFDVKRGQLPEDYRELKAEKAIKCGGVKNLALGRRFWFKKGDKVGNYKRSQQTLCRLKNKMFY